MIRPVILVPRPTRAKTSHLQASVGGEQILKWCPFILTGFTFFTVISANIFIF